MSSLVFTVLRRSGTISKLKKKKGDRHLFIKMKRCLSPFKRCLSPFLIFLLVLVFAGGCATMPEFMNRAYDAQKRAREAGFDKEYVKAGIFTLMTYQRFTPLEKHNHLELLTDTEISNGVKLAEENCHVDLSAYGGKCGRI